LIAVAYPGPTLRPRSIPQNVENLEFGTIHSTGLLGIDDDLRKAKFKRIRSDSYLRVARLPGFRINNRTLIERTQPRRLNKVNKGFYVGDSQGVDELKAA
jgi:hypothetical protein